MSNRQRVLVAVTAFVGAALTAVQLWLVISSWNNDIANAYYWRLAALLQGLAGAIYLGIGLLIVRLRPRIIIGSLLAAIGIGTLMYQTVTEYAVRGLLIDPGSLPAAGAIGVISQTVWILPFSFIPILFLVFPTGKLLSRRWAPIAIVDGLGALVVVVVGLALFWPYRNDGPNVILGEAAPLPAGDLVLSIGTFSIVGALLLSVVSLVVRWRRGSPTIRLQIKWLLLTGLFFGLQGLMILFDIEGVDVLGEVLLLTGLIALPTSVAIAVTRHRLYEIDQILSRTLTYGILTVLLLGAYLGLVFLVRSLLPIEGQFPVAISTLAIAALFNPLRRQIQRLVDRRFNRARYDAELALNAFSEKLRAQGDLVSLGDEIAGVVERTMQPASLALWVR